MSDSRSHPDPDTTPPPEEPPPADTTHRAPTGRATDQTRPVPVTDRDGDGTRSPTGTTAAPPAGAGAGTETTTSSRTTRREDDLVAQHERAEENRREKFGGYNAGADFFGWLVAIALSVLLVSIVGAVVSAVSANLEVDQTDAERSAGTIGLATAITLLVILMIGYYAGGYVAGRMSRYDGGRQGFGVWVIGLLVTIVAVGLGAIFGSEYNILDRVDLPSIPIPRDTLTGGGIIAAVAILVGTLIAALAGGKVGQRYHRRVDRAGF